MAVAVVWSDDDGEVVEFAQPWMGPYLEAYRRCANAAKAAGAVGLTYRATTIARRRDPVFAAAFADVRAEVVDNLEGEMLARAISGQAEVTGIFMLKNLKPEVYSDRLELRHTGGVQHTLEILDGHEPRQVSPPLRHQLAAELLALEAGETIDSTAEDDD